MRQKKKSIGIFDSGFGGLNIMRSIVRTLPQYRYVYLGDTARAPYGNRSQEMIYTFTEQAIDFLFAHDCELVIVACNTASSEALRKIQQEHLPQQHPTKKVLGVLIPAAEEAMAQKTCPRKIGVMATQSTVASNAYVRELKKVDATVRVFQKACPLLVPLVEAGEQNTPEATAVLKRYLKPLLNKNIDTLILGCTHYGILEKKIRAIIGPDITIVSGARVVPKKLKAYLAKHADLEKKLSRQSRADFYSTDCTDTFQILGSKFFGKTISVTKAELG
ncbi:MAG: glutamate racemase [Minisyncoccia bacterium]